MRPRLHADTFYMPMADGVYLRSNRSHLTMKGKTLYRWLESLVPYFNGQHDLEELINGLDSGRQAVVTNLIETLLNHHFLSDASQDELHTLSSEELAIYASEIAFVESFQSSATRQFEIFRQTRVLIIGSGMAFSTCVRACLQGGIKHLVLIKTAEEPGTDIPSTFDEAQLFLPRDSSQHIEELPAPRWENRDDVRDTIQLFDVVLHLSDRPMLARTRLLNELCVEQQKLFLPACFLQGRAWVGPLVKPGVEGCWECAWHRLQSNIKEAEQLLRYAFEDQLDGALDRSFAFPAAIAANQLVFTLFKAVTQADPFDTASQMSVLDLETLSCKSYAVLPHFHCQSCQRPPVPTPEAFLVQIEQLEQREPLERTTFSQQAARCFNDQLGIFRSIGEDSFEQIPLAVCKVEISNPTALLGQSCMHQAIATGLDFQEARQRATQKACEVYAAKAVNPRLLVTQVSTPELVFPHENFLTTAQPATVESWCWALHLQTRKPYLVPAALAFPSLGSEQSSEIAGRGIGSGMSWPEALCQALLDWACYLTVAQLNDRQQPYPRIDLRALSWTPEGEHLLSLLTLAGVQPDVYDVTGPLGVPTFAICMGEQTIAYVSHCDNIQALRAGLELALRHFQSLSAQQPEYDVEPAPLPPLALRSDDFSPLPEVPVPQEWSARLTWLQQRLQAQGWYALAVPLNHDPVLAKVLPFLARVLLVRGKGGR